MWESTVADAQPLLDFVIPALVKRTDLSVQDNVVKIVSELARLINQLDDSDQYPYLEKLSQQLSIPLEILRASIGGRGGGQRRLRRGDRQSDTGADVEVSPNILSGETVQPVEEYVLALLLQFPNLIDEVRDTEPQIFRHTENQQLFTEMLTCPTIEELREGLDPILHGLVSRLEAKELLPTSSHELQLDRDQCISRLKMRYLRDLQGSLAQADVPKVTQSRDVKEIGQMMKDLEPVIPS
jgi:hypothetical protein